MHRDVAGIKGHFFVICPPHAYISVDSKNEISDNCNNKSIGQISTRVAPIYGLLSVPIYVGDIFLFSKWSVCSTDVDEPLHQARAYTSFPVLVSS